MNPEYEDGREEPNETSTGSFYEPRTIPKKWDVSAFVSRGTPAGKEDAEPAEESTDQPDSNDPEEDNSNCSPEPFPQPRTVPGKWDVSDLK
jgi:hypothetical protein